MNLWLRLSATFNEHPKMLQVRKAAGPKADSAELGWYRLLMAAKRYGRWTFASEDHLAHVAGPYYRFVALYRNARLLDDLTVHDGDTYNAIKTPAERKADQRERDTVSRDGVTNGRDGQRDAGVTLDNRQRVQTESTDADAREPDALSTYWDINGKYPVGRTKAWIEELVNEFDDERVSTAIAAESKGDRQGLLGRVRDRLRSEADKADKAKATAELARLEADAVARRITPEQAAENQARVRAELAKMVGPVARS